MPALSRRAMLAAGPAAVLASAAAAQPSGAREIAQRIKGAAPALSVAVMRAGKPVFTEALGFADLELKVEASAATRFRIGSVSKAVTGTLAARLAEQGKLDLDRPIGAYLPDLPTAHRATTTAQLLAHLGGIRHYIARDFDPMTPGGPIDLRQYPSSKEALAVFIDDPLVSQPGQAQNYTTFGFTLAGVVLEAAAGAPFLELVRREVSEPLGVGVQGDVIAAIIPDRARPYDLGARPGEAAPPGRGEVRNAPPINPAYKWAGGGMIATPTDLAKLGSALIRPGYLTAASLQRMLTPVAPANGKVQVPVGMAWRVDADKKGRRRFHHAGNIAGGRAAVIVYPDQALAIAMAVNFTSALLDPLTPAAELADLFAA